MSVEWLESMVGRRLTKAQIVEIMVDALEYLEHSNSRGRTKWTATETAALNWLESR